MKTIPLIVDAVPDKPDKAKKKKVPWWRLVIRDYSDKVVFAPNKRYDSQYAALRAGGRYVTRHRKTGSFDPPANVNADTVEKIAAVGLSLVQAARIVEARRKDGPFRNLAELKARTQVDEPTLDGIGRRLVF